MRVAERSGDFIAAPLADSAVVAILEPSAYAPLLEVGLSAADATDRVVEHALCH